MRSLADRIQYLVNNTTANPLVDAIVDYVSVVDTDLCIFTKDGSLPLLDIDKYDKYFMVQYNMRKNYVETISKDDDEGNPIDLRNDVRYLLRKNTETYRPELVIQIFMPDMSVKHIYFTIGYELLSLIVELCLAKNYYFVNFNADKSDLLPQHVYYKLM